MYSQLGKFKITFFVAVTTSIGFILYSGELTSQMLLVTFGVFLLASGSSALNHYQERIPDSKMDRTRGRPLPSGRIKGYYVLIYSSILTLSGALLIYFSSNPVALMLGLLAFIWYNLIYTPLKRKYVLAVVPGSLIGAIPPMIGWVAAGGNPFAPQILTLCLFFFIWQIPHFWLLLLIYGKDYEKAGFPTLTQLFSNQQLTRITFIWIVALSIACLLIPAFNISNSGATTLLLLLLGIWLIWESKTILSNYMERIVFKKAFMRVNIYVLAVVLLISMDKLVF